MRRLVVGVLLVSSLAHADGDPRDVFGLGKKPKQEPPLDCSDGTAFGCTGPSDPLDERASPYSLRRSALAIRRPSRCLQWEIWSELRPSNAPISRARKRLWRITVRRTCGAAPRVSARKNPAYTSRRPAGTSGTTTLLGSGLNVPPPNEVIRYLWPMTVDGTEYWVQAKMSDALSGTTFVDDPVGALTHLDGAFRLRGDCQTIGVVATCVHLKWLEGSFDLDANQVRMRVPLGDAVAPHFVPGAVIFSAATLQMTASIQVLVSNALTSDSVTIEEPYAIPGT